MIFEPVKASRKVSFVLNEQMIECCNEEDNVATGTNIIVDISTKNDATSSYSNAYTTSDTINHGAVK